MRDVLLLVDYFTDFAHEDGEALLASLEQRAPGVRSLIESSRERAVPVVYANDNLDVWDGQAAGIVERALAGPGGHVLADLAPVRGDCFVVKPKYSAFDATPLALLLERLGGNAFSWQAWRRRCASHRRLSLPASTGSR